MIDNLIVTAKMNGVVPQAWLANVLARVADHPDDLLPWRWAASQVGAADYTIARVARLLGEDEVLLAAIAADNGPGRWLPCPRSRQGRVHDRVHGVWRRNPCRSQAKETTHIAAEALD